MVTRLSPVKSTGSENDQFLGRMSRAQEQNQLKGNFGQIFDCLIGCGKQGRVEPKKSLSELDGDYN